MVIIKLRPGSLVFLSYRYYRVGGSSYHLHPEYQPFKNATNILHCNLFKTTLNMGDFPLTVTFATTCSNTVAIVELCPFKDSYSEGAELYI